MPRPKREKPASKRVVTLPDELWDYIDNLERNPLSGKSQYGFRSKYFERLVRLDKKRTEGIIDLTHEEETEI